MFLCRPGSSRHWFLFVCSIRDCDQGRPWSVRSAFPPWTHVCWRYWFCVLPSVSSADSVYLTPFWHRKPRWKNIVNYKDITVVVVKYLIIFKKIAGINTSDIIRQKPEVPDGVQLHEASCFWQALLCLSQYFTHILCLCILCYSKQINSYYVNFKATLPRFVPSTIKVVVLPVQTQLFISCTWQLHVSAIEIYLYCICMVHTVVLLQSLVAVCRPTQHVKFIFWNPKVVFQVFRSYLFLCESWWWLTAIAETCCPYSVFVKINWRAVLDVTHLPNYTNMATFMMSTRTNGNIQNCEYFWKIIPSANFSSRRN
jgi:hypothetical protein